MIRLSPQKHPLVLVAVAALVGLLWDQTGGSDRHMGYTVLAAIVGVLFYPVISPFRHLYHVIPQVAVAALGVTYLVIQVLPRGHQPSRLIVAALVLSFLFFGASHKPLSFKANPTRDRDLWPFDSLAGASRRRDAAFAPAGLFLDLPLGRPSGLDGVSAAKYSNRNSGRQSPNQPFLGR